MHNIRKHDSQPCRTVVYPRWYAACSIVPTRNRGDVQIMGSNQHRCISKWICGCLAATVYGTAWAAPSTSTSEDTGLEEITVTAERFNSTIQNTPISISAFSGDQLSAAGLTRIEDLAHEIPGLSMRSAGPGLTEDKARGLASNGGAAPTVGFYLAENPLSPPAVSQPGKAVIGPTLHYLERLDLSVR